MADAALSGCAGLSLSHPNGWNAVPDRPVHATYKFEVFSLAKQQPVCFAHSHMTLGGFGLYTYLRQVSSKSNYIYRFDDRDIAGRFAPERGVSKDTCNRLRNALAEKGFIEWTEPKRRDSFGRYLPRMGRILSHGEYAQKYPDSCAAVAAASSDNATGTSIKTGADPVSNQPISLSHQCDIKGINTKHDKKQNEIAAACFPPSPETSNKSSSAAELEPPVAASLQVKSETGAVQGVQDFCKKFAAPELSELPPSVQRLAELLENHVHQQQRTDGLENLERIAKLSPSQAEALFKWVIENPDPFWRSRMSGRTALRFFCKNAVTIAAQYNNNTQKRAKTSKGKLKAASVVPDAAKPFNYVEETL